MGSFRILFESTVPYPSGGDSLERIFSDDKTACAQGLDLGMENGDQVRSKIWEVSRSTR